MTDAFDRLEAWLAEEPDDESYATVSRGESAPWQVRLFRGEANLCVADAEGETLEAAVEGALVLYGEFQEGASR
jgi:hypothetical protein